jgi:transcriptional regulator with XRE-family HTH domain
MDPKVLREYRKSRQESQFQFWLRFGVTQSRGSRFEMGTDIPSPVAILLRLYLDGKITDCDLRKPEH